MSQNQRMQWRTGTVVVVAMLSGCFSPSSEVAAPPVNPGISNVAGMVTMPFRVDCAGPANELAMLGTLCGTVTNSAFWTGTDAPAGMAMSLGPEGGPWLLVYNRLESEPGDGNVAADAKYSAFVLLSGGGDSTNARLGGWTKGERVAAGSVTSQLVRFQACSFNWVAQGTFTWRSTTISVAWSAANAC